MIRHAEIADSLKLAWLDAAVHGNAAGLKSEWEKNIDTDYVLLSVKDGTDAPLAALHCGKVNDTLRVYQVFTEPFSRRQGHASALLDAAIALADQQHLATTLTVDPYKTGAIQLYERKGFVFDGLSSCRWNNMVRSPQSNGPSGAWSP